MDEATQRDLAALADGSLEPTARDALLRRAAESPELADALARQRHAVAAVRLAAAQPAPDALRARVAAMVAAAGDAHETDRAGAPARHRRRLPRPRVFALGSTVAALAAAAVILFAGGPQSPSVAEAAQVALAPARSAAPAAHPATNTLDASVDGVAYPYWADTTGWRATGSRSDTLHGRPVRTVFYENAKGERIGYSIAAGSPLPAEGGSTIERGGVGYRTLRSGGAVIVTWLRDGHTCILAARDVDASVLLRLAAWA
jgi:anti-sigma factor RsiW